MAVSRALTKLGYTTKITLTVTYPGAYYKELDPSPTVLK
jgi:hypothetical protein